MKTRTLQVVLIELEDGQRGAFIGIPLISEALKKKCHIQKIWFSDIDEVPDDLIVEQLTELAWYRAHMKDEPVH